MMLCMFIHCLNSGISYNNHELIQVVVPTNVTTHKNFQGTQYKFRPTFSFVFSAYHPEALGSNPEHNICVHIFIDILGIGIKGK